VASFCNLADKSFAGLSTAQATGGLVR